MEKKKTQLTYRLAACWKMIWGVHLSCTLQQHDYFHFHRELDGGRHGDRWRFFFLQCWCSLRWWRVLEPAGLCSPLCTEAPFTGFIRKNRWQEILLVFTHRNVCISKTAMKMLLKKNSFKGSISPNNVKDPSTRRKPFRSLVFLINSIKHASSHLSTFFFLALSLCSEWFTLFFIIIIIILVHTIV